ncbi:SAVED domain-containing protein [Aureisphaera galaxeae]|uniref:Hachiman antiphage defense system protein HamA n=1 Tax=Aureisphaera galaxeae TaxID=1538023 RepID=UPI0023504A0F|nr:Hachiman antiphage defense system protein HamA [Aureisphaera galaxeae]MDC8002920.1 SAVED domain-containing protein [Aureisphaera galaxeae]
MRKSLYNLVKNTIIYRYDLPNLAQAIPKTLFSTENDKCYSIVDEQALIEIIYNSIIDYSFNEFDFTQRDLEDLHAIAFQERIRYNESDSQTSKLRYGFFGEVLLHCILKLFFKTDTLISKGYFYDPLTKAEARGYDAYHLIEENDEVGLWFGETKFHISYRNALNDVLGKIKSSLSDNYLRTNLLAIRKNRENLNIKGSRIEAILNDWDANPNIRIIEELQQHSINLIYPIIILFQQSKAGYDNSIKKIPEYIEENYSLEQYDLSIPYSVFFIFIPIEDVRKIKKEVLEWIKLKKPLI